jgi:hypothetical protein
MAKLAGKKTISVDEMSQEIDLKRYLGRDATPAEKRLFAELAVERINERTLDGRTIHGGSFKRYTQEYADLKGVTRDAVDLFLKGDMLDSIESKDAGKNKVKIEITDNLDTKKGYNHHTGDTLPKRPWFGITTKEARVIANEVKQPVREESQTFTLADLREALRGLGLEQE